MSEQDEIWERDDIIAELRARVAKLEAALTKMVYKTASYFWDCPKCKRKNFGDSMDCWLCMTAQPAPVIEECLALRARVAKLEAALEQSVTLQSHYAELLNTYDGGKRLTFASVEAWLDRLAALKGAPQ